MLTQEEKFIQMTTKPIGRTICKLALPCIVSMLVSSFYNMADTYFVGHMNDADPTATTSATAAIGVVFSMMAIIQAVGFFFGHGSGNYISRQLGEKNYKEASTMAANGFFSALAIGLLICVLGLSFLKPLAYLLGSSKTMLPYTMDYLSVILLGAPWMTASLVLNNQLRFQGSAIYSMLGIISGAVLNIGLDPLLIYVFDMGIAGAGWATIISQLISFIILLIGCQRGGNLRISIRNVRLRWYYFWQIIRGGLPSLARQSLASLATICLNHAALPLGDAVTAAMGVVQRIVMFGASAMIGFGQGFQPFCGFNYGAKLYSRVRKAFWFCVKYSFIFLMVVSTVVFIFAREMVDWFSNDPAVIECGAMALRFQCLSFPFQSWIVMSNMMEQVMGKTLPATFLAMARQGIFFIPTVLLFAFLWRETGIQITQAVSDTLTLMCAIPLHLFILRKLPRQDG